MATAAPAAPAATGLRRSGRTTRLPDRYDPPLLPTNTRPPRATASDLRRGFLARLYFEINEAVTNNANPATGNAIRDFMRQARLARCLRELSVQQNQTLTQRVTAYVPENPVQTQVFTLLSQDLHPNLAVMLRRLGKLTEDVWAAATCACACSGTFRGAIARPNSGDGSTLNWAAVKDLIMENYVSIELFFLTRIRCDWTTLLTVSNNHFGSALIQAGPIWQTLTPNQRTTGQYTAATFGIIRAEEVPWNALGSTSPRHPHEWYLPGGAESGERCKITFTVTADLVQYHNTVAGRAAGQVKTVLQRNIDLARFCMEYPWTRRNQWISRIDPRYAGFFTPGCVAHPNPLVQAVCPVVTGSLQQTIARTCTCTFRVLQSRNNHPSTPLVEIVTYPRLGNGIRALQSIETNQYLGVYIGEMYPTKKKSGALHSYRYGGLEGECYAMDQSIQLRHRHPPRNGDGGRPMALEADEFTHFYIDPAVSGNWTRYINHSCDPNTIYAQVNVGQRLLIIVQAIRPIRFGDPITASYGREYFKGRLFACACGAAKCNKWKMSWNNRDMKQKNGKDFVDVGGNVITPPGTLGKAIKNASTDLPAWLSGEANMVIEARVAPWKAYSKRRSTQTKLTGKRKSVLVEESPAVEKKVRSK